jgi:hypothetical protein
LLLLLLLLLLVLAATLPLPAPYCCYQWCTEASKKLNGSLKMYAYHGSNRCGQMPPSISQHGD